jgi:S-(hydroxymethyl)glutathione dehydrogenase/alcohol dehydrogenase
MKNNIPKFTKAAVLFKLQKKLRIIDLKIPELKKGQVLVKILYSSICKSQLMEINGGRDNKKWLPHLLGHEGSGIIIKIGDAVSKVKIGDEVILTWIRSSGVESANPMYEFHNQIINAGKVTTFSNYSIVSENRIIKKPKNISHKQAPLLGCCFMTGAGMVYNETKPKKNNNILIIGFGGIGLAVFLALREKKIKKILVIENNNKRIQIAKKLGIHNIVTDLSSKSYKRIIKNFKGKIDICYECAGSPRTIEFAMKIIKNSGHVHFASHPDKSAFIRLKPYDLISGKKITGSWGGGCKPDIDINKFKKIIKKNSNKLKNIINKEYQLKDINLAIKDFKSGKVFRPIIAM